jgi:hypothetical protein
MASGHVTAPHKQAEHMAAPTSIALLSKKTLPTGGRPHMAATSTGRRNTCVKSLCWRFKL